MRKKPVKRIPQPERMTHPKHRRKRNRENRRIRKEMNRKNTRKNPARMNRLGPGTQLNWIGKMNRRIRTGRIRRM